MKRRGIGGKNFLSGGLGFGFERHLMPRPFEASARSVDVLLRSARTALVALRMAAGQCRSRRPRKRPSHQ